MNSYLHAFILTCMHAWIQMTYKHTQTFPNSVNKPGRFKYLVKGFQLHMRWDEMSRAEELGTSTCGRGLCLEAFKQALSNTRQNSEQLALLCGLCRLVERPGGPGTRPWLKCLSVDDLALLTQRFGKPPSPADALLDPNQVSVPTDVVEWPDIMSVSPGDRPNDSSQLQVECPRIAVMIKNFRHPCCTITKMKNRTLAHPVPCVHKLLLSLLQFRE